MTVIQFELDIFLSNCSASNFFFLSFRSKETQALLNHARSLFFGSGSDGTDFLNCWTTMDVFKAQPQIYIYKNRVRCRCLGTYDLGISTST